MEQVKKRNRWLDWGYFAALLAVWIFFGGDDIGDMVFLFVFENVTMFLALLLFMMSFGTWGNVKKDLTKEGVKKKWHLIFLAPFLSVGVFLFHFAGLIVFLMIVNQLTIEFAAGYLCEKGHCSYESLQILSEGGFFMESDVLNKLFSRYDLGLNLMMGIMVVKAFIDLIIARSRVEKDADKEIETSINSFLNIAASSIAACVSIFLACILWVMLSEGFPNETWVIWVVIIVFRLLYQGLMRLAEGMISEA